MSKHTPHPWKAVEGDTLNPDRPWGVVRLFTADECESIDGDAGRLGYLSEVIAEVCSAPGGIAKADAQLMAAAPEMYDVLEQIHDSGTFECCCGHTPCIGSCISTLIEKALVKADGEEVE